MAKHTLTFNGPPISAVLTQQQLDDVLSFIGSIDDDTAPSDSLMDTFLEEHPLQQ
jgi:hypothetical protein